GPAVRAELRAGRRHGAASGAGLGRGRRERAAALRAELPGGNRRVARRARDRSTSRLRSLLRLRITLLRRRVTALLRVRVTALLRVAGLLHALVTHLGHGGAHPDAGAAQARAPATAPT